LLAIAAFAFGSVPAFSQHQQKPGTGRHEHPITVTKSTPLWLQYLAAGDKAKKTDPEGAKKYWIAALTTLDKNPSTFKPLYFGKLENRIVGIYPDDWSNSKLDNKAEIKAREQQVAMYGSLAKLSTKVPSFKNLIQHEAQGRYKKASDDLAKAKTEKSKDAPNQG
jgi:hypothetical protein